MDAQLRTGSFVDARDEQRDQRVLLHARTDRGARVAQIGAAIAQVRAALFVDISGAIIGLGHQQPVGEVAADVPPARVDMVEDAEPHVPIRPGPEGGQRLTAAIIGYWALKMIGSGT